VSSKVLPHGPKGCRRNVCRNVWETLVLWSGVVKEGTREQGQEVGEMSRALFLVSRVAGWLIVPLYIAGASAYYLLAISAGLWNDDAVVDNVAGVMLGVGFGAFAVVGALLVVRWPTNAVGWILAAIGLRVSIFNAGGAYASYVIVTRARPDPLAVFGAWAANCYWFLMLALTLIYLPMLFPDGRLLSRRWLPVAVIGGIATLGIVLPRALVNTLPVREVTGRGIANPIGIEGLGKISDLPISGVSEALFLIAAVGAVASVAVRFRRSRGVERQQMKLFAYVIVVLIGGSVLAGGLSDLTGAGWLEGVSFVLSMVGLMCLPIAVGVAILRHRLYEIDLIINRTLVYGPLTAALALMYFGGVATTQLVLRAHRPTTAAPTRHRSLHARDSSSVQPFEATHPGIHRQTLLPQQLRRQKDPRCLLRQPARRNGLGRAER
jgi:hypothetical protein